MGDTTFILTPDNPEWDRWLDRAPHDFHSRADYHAFAERMGEGRAMLLVHGREDRFLAWPYLLRDLDNGQTDATSVYGYTGPTGAGLDDAGFLATAWDACRAAWSEQKLITLFTRFHPILENHNIANDFHGDAQPDGGEILDLGRSVSMDLTLDEDTRRMQYPQPLRQDIKKSERQGLVVELDRDWRFLPEFRDFYRATMKRNEAADRYLFSDAYFDDLRRALGPIGHLAVARVEDDAAAVLLFTVQGAIATAHLTGINPKMSRYSPLKALLDRTCDIARDLAADKFHLGAGRGGAEDSLFDFKSRFSPDRHMFRAGRWILDATAHDQMTRARDTKPTQGFFPAYRAPAQADSANP
mgnify:CR=1 FL=1